MIPPIERPLSETLIEKLVNSIVLPKELRNYILSFNIERAPSLKEKSIQAYNLFTEKLKQSSHIKEYELEPFVQYPHYITLGFVIEKLGDKKFPGS